MNKTTSYLMLLLIAVVYSFCLPATSKADDNFSGTGIELVQECTNKNFQENNWKLERMCEFCTWRHSRNLGISNYIA